MGGTPVCSSYSSLTSDCSLFLPLWKIFAFLRRTGRGLYETSTLYSVPDQQCEFKICICSCSQAVYKPAWHIPLLCVQWETPDDGQRNCPKHVEFHSKNKIEKLLHLVGFIIRKVNRNHGHVSVKFLIHTAALVQSKESTFHTNRGPFYEERRKFFREVGRDYSQKWVMSNSSKQECLPS
jgi:hypothetical protein